MNHCCAVRCCPSRLSAMGAGKDVIILLLDPTISVAEDMLDTAHAINNLYVMSKINITHDVHTHE